MMLERKNEMGVEGLNNSNQPSVDQLKKQAEAKKQAALNQQKADSMKNSSVWSVNVSNSYSQDTTKTKAKTQTQSTSQKKTTSAQPKPVAQPQKKAATVSTAASHSSNAPATPKKVQTNTTPQVKTTTTPASVVKTGVFNPPEILKDFQSIKMSTKTNPVADEGGIRFYAPNAADPNAEKSKIQTKVVGENTIITLGDPKAGYGKKTSISIPTALIEKNKENGAAVIYDKETETYAFCNLEGAKIINPKQDAKTENLQSKRNTVQGEKVFMQGCKGCTIDSNDSINIAKDSSDVVHDKTGVIGSSGSSESYAIFDCQDTTVKTSGDKDKVYVQNSNVTLQPSQDDEKTNFKSSFGQRNQDLDQVLVASDSNSTINVKYDDSPLTKSSGDLFQTGFNAATFVPGWFGSDAKAGAQIAKTEIAGKTAKTDGSATVADTGTFAADSRFPEFSGLNMKGQASFRSAGGVTFFAPNQTDPATLASLISVKDDGKNTIITVNNAEKGSLTKDVTERNWGHSTIVIPNESIKANSDNGAAVVFDPETQTFAYCNLKDANIRGDHQSINENSTYSDNFAYHNRPKLQTQGENVMMRGCENCTYDANDLISLAHDHTWHGDLPNSQSKSLIGSGSKEGIVAIGCNNMKLIAGGDGDKIQIEDSNDVNIKSTKNEADEAKLYSDGAQAIYKKNLNVNVSADAGSSLTMNIANTILKAAKGR